MTKSKSYSFLFGSAISENTSEVFIHCNENIRLSPTYSLFAALSSPLYTRRLQNIRLLSRCTLIIWLMVVINCHRFYLLHSSIKYREFVSELKCLSPSLSLSLSPSTSPSLLFEEALEPTRIHSCGGKKHFRHCFPFK